MVAEGFKFLVQKLSIFGPTSKIENALITDFFFSISITTIDIYTQ